VSANWQAGSANWQAGSANWHAGDVGTNATPCQDAAWFEESIHRAHRLLMESRASGYLRDWVESTNRLQVAVRELQAAQSGLQQHTLPPADRRRAWTQVANFAGELRKTQAIHAQAETIFSDWAQLFNNATACEPGAGYSSEGVAPIFRAPTGLRVEMEG
jgi:hypothetical protein